MSIDIIKGGHIYHDVIFWCLKSCAEGSTLGFSASPSWFQKPECAENSFLNFYSMKPKMSD